MSNDNSGKHIKEAAILVFNPIIFDILYEAATAYEGSDVKFFKGLDYSCHPGMEERLQIMAGQVSSSLDLEDDESLSFSRLVTEYQRQSFRLFSTSAYS